MNQPAVYCRAFYTTPCSTNISGHPFFYPPFQNGIFSRGVQGDRSYPSQWGWTSYLAREVRSVKAYFKLNNISVIRRSFLELSIHQNRKSSIIPIVSEANQYCCLKVNRQQRVKTDSGCYLWYLTAFIDGMRLFAVAGPKTDSWDIQSSGCGYTIGTKIPLN